MTSPAPTNEATLSWAEIVDHCSRLHTTRTRPELPWDENSARREDSQMLDVLIDETPACVIPTRMHEPGFYVRSRTPENDGRWHPPGWILRGDDELATFRRLVEQGRVHREVSQ